MGTRAGQGEQTPPHPRLGRFRVCLEQTQRQAAFSLLPICVSQERGAQPGLEKLKKEREAEKREPGHLGGTGNAFHP